MREGGHSMGRSGCKHPRSSVESASDPTAAQYFSEVGRYKLPSAKEERELFTRYKAAQTRAELGHTSSERDAGARERTKIGQEIACGYLRFVMREARRKTNDPQLLKDLISQGNIGLMVGVERFDPARNVRFLTYAANWIKVCMQEYLHKLGTVHVPSHTRKEMRRKRLQESAQITQGSLRDFTFEEPTTTPIDEVVIVAEDNTEESARADECDMFDYMEQADLNRAERLVMTYMFGLRGFEMNSEDIVQFLYELDDSLFDVYEVDALRKSAMEKLRALMAAKGIATMRDIW